MNFINKLDTPRRIDLRTSFMTPFQGVSLLLSRPSLLFKVFLCSLGIMLSMPLFVVGFVTIPVFLCMAMLMIINEITGPEHSLSELLSLAYVNMKTKVKAFIIISFLPLLLSLHILYGLSHNPGSMIVYEIFAVLCFFIVWGIVTANCMLICFKKNQTVLNSVYESINLVMSQPFMIFGQLLAWIMGLMFVAAVLFSYILLLPQVGIQHGTLLETVAVLLITFLAISAYITFYTSGVTALLYHWYGNEYETGE